MKIFSLQDIKKHIDLEHVLRLQEQGFVAASKGLVQTPMPMLIETQSPAGSYHVKCAHLEGEAFWISKIAGSPDGLPLKGVMVGVDIQTGKPAFILQDEGYLTALRTAVAGLITAKYFAPFSLESIGILGTGVQARLQLELLKEITPCRRVYVWGRCAKKMAAYQEEMSAHGFLIHPASSPQEVAHACQLIVTTTPSTKALLYAADIQPGTHITAVGADSPGKQELDPRLLSKADIIAVDSRKQCLDHGECQHAFLKALIKERDLIELGDVISNPKLARENNQQISVCDLTGIAIQDLLISKSVVEKSNKSPL